MGSLSALWRASGTGFQRVSSSPSSQHGLEARKTGKDACPTRLGGIVAKRGHWLLLLLLPLLPLLPFAARALGVSEVVRGLPAGFVPGEPMMLTNRVTLSPLVGVYAVEESVPAGWSVELVSHGGTFDTTQRTLRWGPFYDQTERTLTVRLVPSAGDEQVALAGVVAFDGQTTVVRGPALLPRLRPSVTRELPARFYPGLPLALTWRVVRTSDVQAIAIEDRLPAGWTLGTVSDGGVFDAVTRKVKWVLVGATASEFALTATVLPPEGSLGMVEFTGVAAFDDWIADVSGPSESTGSFGDATRRLPTHYVPGTSFTLTNEVQVAANTGFYALEDSVPAGWTVGAISHGGVFDANLRKVKWGPFSDALARDLTVALTPGADGHGPVSFLGTVSLVNATRLIGGVAQLPLAVSAAVRQLPVTYLPDRTFTLTVIGTPAPQVQAWSVEDSVPAGWSVGPLSDGGQWDPQSRRLRWGPFFDATPRTLTAEITPSPAAVGTVAFSGTAAFDEIVMTVAGPDDAASQVGSIRRELAAHFSPGTALPLRVRVIPAGVGFHAVEERLPAGWTASSPSDGGVFDAATGKLRWGPFADRLERELQATLHPPAGATALATFAGQASFDGVLVTTGGATTSVLLQAPRSQVPMATADTVSRAPRTVVKIALRQLLANDHDPDADPLQLFTLDAHSEAGGTVYLDGAWVIYEPPASDPVNDLFSYSITDGLGGVASAVVNVSVPPPDDGPSRNLLSLELDGADQVVRFVGIPGRTYRVQFSATLISPAWLTLDTLTAGPTGTLTFRHAGWASSTGFYRTQNP